MPDIEEGDGLRAECWFCNTTFTKEDYHKSCGFWVCPGCAKCGCDLDPFTKQALEKTYRALGRKVT